MSQKDAHGVVLAVTVVKLSQDILRTASNMHEMSQDVLRYASRIHLAAHRHHLHKQETAMSQSPDGVHSVELIVTLSNNFEQMDASRM